LAPNDGYQLKNGTSFAAPLVSALAALLKSNNPNLSSAEIETCIKGSAEDISFLNSGFNGLIGAGRINAYEAIRCVQLENAAYNIALEFETALPDRLCTGSLSPVVRLRNTGSQTLNTLTLRAQLGNEPPNFYTIDTILPQGESMLLPMQAITPSPGNQNYRVQLVGLLNGQNADVYSPDNLLQHAIVVIGGLGEPLPFTENFESGTFATKNWLIVNENDAFSWSINPAVSPEPGSNAAMLGYYVNPAIGSRDYLQTPPLDFSGVGSATLQFDFAYMPRFQNISDSLIVSYSTDCGNTFIRLIELSGNTLATTQAFPDNFLAQESTLWCGASNFAACYSSALDVLAGNTNVILRWEGYCNNGNNIYLDNIRIEGSATNAPPQAAFDANWDLPACVGKLVQFQNESTGYPTSYLWTFTGGNPSESSLENPEITYSIPGIYPVSLIATNNNGSDTLLVNQFVEAVELPQLTISTSSDTICGGNTAQLIASGASYYYWNSGPAMSATVGDSVNVSPQSNATYLVNGVSAEGCSASASQSIYVVSQPSIPSITVDGAYLVASPGIGYEWYLNGVLLANETNQTLLPQQNGNYNVRVYIQDDCSSISAVFPVNFAGMSEKNESELFVVFPNPADKQLMVKLKESVQCIKAFDRIGNCVFVSTSGVSTIETATWSAGLYSIAVYFDNGKTTSKQVQIIH
jgi:PKD repeat protein